MNKLLPLSSGQFCFGWLLVTLKVRQWTKLSLIQIFGQKLDRCDTLFVALFVSVRLLLRSSKGGKLENKSRNWHMLKEFSVQKHLLLILGISWRHSGIDLSILIFCNNLLVTPVILRVHILSKGMSLSQFFPISVFVNSLFLLH